MDLHLARMIGEGFYGVCQRNPGSSETSISLLLAAQPRSAIPFSFFHLPIWSQPASLCFIPWSYLQRNASLSISLNRSFFLSLSGFHYFDFLFLFHAFILSCPGGCRLFALYSILVRVKAGFYWTHTENMHTSAMPSFKDKNLANSQLTKLLSQTEYLSRS